MDVEVVVRLTEEETEREALRERLRLAVLERLLDDVALPVRELVSDTLEVIDLLDVNGCV